MPLAVPSPIDRRVIRRIAIRALIAPLTVTVTRRELEEEIGLAHANGCRLRLDQLLRARDYEFFSDVLGIHRHIDRTTGAIGGGWMPHFAARAAQPRKAA